MMIKPLVLSAVVASAVAREKPPVSGLKTVCQDYCTMEPQEKACVEGTRGATNADIFMPSGAAAGDYVGPGTKLGEMAGPVTSSPFLFYGHSYDQFYISSHGFVHITNTGHSSVNLGDYYNTQSRHLSQDSGYAMIAPFWSDFDARDGGEWGFRELMNGDPELAQVDEIIKKAVQNGVQGSDNFQATYGFIMTFKGMIITETTSDRTNTLQCIMTHDGATSYVVFHYGDIEMDSSVYTGADKCTGEGGHSSHVGFRDSKGLGNVFLHPRSSKPEVVDIEHFTNCGTVGRYVYRVDQEEIVSPPETQAAPEPEFVSTGIDGIITAMVNGVNDQNVMDHGCHCSGKGGAAVDEVDMLCKKWKQARNCLMKAGGACETSNIDFYEVVGTDCQNTDPNTCDGAACAVDAKFLADINAVANFQTFTANPIATCPATTATAGGNDSCCGTAPAVVLYNSNNQQCAANGVVV